MNADARPPTSGHTMRRFLVELRGKLRRLLESTLNNVAGAFMMLLGIGALIGALRWVAEWLDARGFTVTAICFVAACGLALFVLLARARPAHFRNPEGRIVVGYLVGFVLAIAMFWTFVFGLLAFLLMKTGAMSFTFRAGSTAPLSDLFDTFLWYFIDLVPGGFNDAFEWGPDVKLANGWQGCMLYVFRALILFQLFALAAKLYAARHAVRRPAAT